MFRYAKAAALGAAAFLAFVYLTLCVAFWGYPPSLGDWDGACRLFLFFGGIAAAVLGALTEQHEGKAA